ncbi:hypothetical protein ACWGMA_48460 [Streptomyces asiaticus]
MLGPIETTTDEDVPLLFATNTFGPLEAIRQAIPQLRGGTPSPQAPRSRPLR